ncbi:MAG TPA: TolC family protein [Polyangiaceae bacterium]|nr:TolC family protein [Polyangiaceae bacterium]
MPATALATQPLDTFLAGGHEANFDARVQEAVALQRSWESDAALGRILPTFTATGRYTRNEIERVLPAGSFGAGSPEVPLQLHDQLDGTLQLDVPIIDLAGYYRYRQAQHIAKSADAGRAQTNADVDKLVARQYYLFLGTEALVTAAENTVRIANDNLDLVRIKKESGTATELDVQRAVANVERYNQDLADAKLARTLASRQLQTLTGITPEAVQAYPVDDLHHEAPLEAWIEVKDTPSDRVQRALLDAAAAGKKAAAFSLLPTLAGSANERFTNVSGLVGASNYYTLSLTATWRLDYGTYSQAQASSYAAQASAVQAERQRRGLEDSIYDAYQRVEAGIVKSASARAQADAARIASDLALERYRAGALTQLDVTAAQRDQFQAVASRIQADADLAYQRVALRVVAGKTPNYQPAGFTAEGSNERTETLEKPEAPTTPATNPSAPPTSTTTPSTTPQTP